MNLVGTRVKHRIYGSHGIVEQQTDSMILVRFSGAHPRLKEEMKFSFPNETTFREFLIADEANLQKEILMNDLSPYPCVELNGISWWRIDEKRWVDAMMRCPRDGIITLQLEDLHVEQTFRDTLAAMPIESLIQEGTDIRNELKERQSGRPGNSLTVGEKRRARRGVIFMETAFERLESPEYSSAYKWAVLKDNLHTLSALYRNAGQSEKCYTDLFMKYKALRPTVFNSKFLTSLSASFCDMGDLEGAEWACDAAVSFGASPSGIHLKNVMYRIEAMKEEQNGE